jgi:probable HAF family extracellular repeat protein
MFPGMQLLQSQEALGPPVTFAYTAVNYPGATYTEAFAINNSKEVIGTYGTAFQLQNGYQELNGNFVTDNCVLTNETLMSDVNNKGEIVGSYAGNDNGNIEGFIWEGNGQCQTIADPNGPAATDVWGVNDSGTLVGFYTDSTTLNYQAFKWINGVFTNFGCPGWTNTRAYGINDAGIIVGDNANTTSGPFSGFALASGKCIPVNYPGAVSTSAKGINKSDVICGWYTDSSGAFHGFIESGGKFQSINYPGAVSTLVFHCNDKAQVAGWYTDAVGATHAFVATPKK